MVRQTVYRLGNVCLCVGKLEFGFVSLLLITDKFLCMENVGDCFVILPTV